VAGVGMCRRSLGKTNMSVIALILILVVLGVVAYFVNTSAKINGTFKWLINAVLIVVAVLLILTAFGVWDELKGMKVPKI
jgi:RsiW-degrading membrane proteinase PrsW (M82 family)